MGLSCYLAETKLTAGYKRAAAFDVLGQGLLCLTEEKKTVRVKSQILA